MAQPPTVLRMNDFLHFLERLGRKIALHADLIGPEHSQIGYQAANQCPPGGDPGGGIQGPIENPGPASLLRQGPDALKPPNLSG